MFHDISPPMAGLVSLWCMTLLYGVHLVVYFSCVSILLRRRKSQKPAVIVIFLGTASVQFMLSTVYLALGLRMLIEGFIWAELTPGGSIAYWNDASLPIQVARKGVYMTNSLVGDAILVWRLYAVWDNIFICILPALIIIGTAVCGYTSTADLARVDPNAGPGALFEIAKWLFGAWSLSISIQILVTIAIAGRIFWISRRTSQAQGVSNRYMSIVWIIVESGAIYSISTIILLAFFDLQTQAGGVIGSCLAQICAIVPTLIIVRVGMGRSFQSQTTSQMSGLTLPVSRPIQFSIRSASFEQSLGGSSHEVSAEKLEWVGETRESSLNAI